MYLLSSLAVAALCLAGITALPSPGLGSRIVNGQPAVAEQLPWMAAIYYATSSENYQFCGGSLVSERWVLTAAHCVINANGFIIYLGVTSLVANDPHRVTVQATRSIVHPDYSPTVPYSNDAGLIDLEVAVPLSTFVQPIALDTRFVQPGVASLTSGWGTAREADTVLNDNLHYVELLTISNLECLLFYGNLIDYKLICTLGLGQGNCLGDTGGPLVIYDENSIPLLAGISTFPSCENPYPAAYLRSTVISDWVAEVIGSQNITKV